VRRMLIGSAPGGRSIPATGAERAEGRCKRALRYKISAWGKRLKLLKNPVI